MPAWNLFTQENKTLGKMKAEPDLSLVQGKFSVSLEIDVSLFRFYYLTVHESFLHFFKNVSKHVTSPVIRAKLQNTPLVIYAVSLLSIAYQLPLVIGH